MAVALATQALELFLLMGLSTIPDQLGVRIIDRARPTALAPHDRKALLSQMLAA